MYVKRAERNDSRINVNRGVKRNAKTRLDNHQIMVKSKGILIVFKKTIECQTVEFEGNDMDQKRYLSNNSSLAEAAELWLHEKKRDVRESTYALYYQKVHYYINPQLGNLLVKNITEEVLNDFLKKQIKDECMKQGGLSWKTVSDVRSVLRMILEWISRNGFPLIGNIKLHMPPPKPSGLETMTLKEQRKLEKYLLDGMNEIRMGLLLSLYTGLRIGEVCGLKWGDIDFKRGTLSVDRTVMRIQDTDDRQTKKTKVIVSEPKTYCSNRTIPVPRDIMVLLKKQRRSNNRFVLTGEETCMEPRNLTGHYKRILREAGLDSYKFHALRHTFATRCVEQGIDIKTLSEIMGHSSVKITMDRYVHPSLEYKKKQVNRLKLPASTD